MKSNNLLLFCSIPAAYKVIIYYSKFEIFQGVQKILKNAGDKLKHTHSSTSKNSRSSTRSQSQAQAHGTRALPGDAQLK